MTFEEEQKQYQDFCIEFAKKTKEIKDDYDKMTRQNQAKFRRDVEKIITLNAMEELSKYYRKWGGMTYNTTTK